MFGRDIIHSLGAFCDGKTLARMSCVCKNWNRWIQMKEKLVQKKYIHYSVLFFPTSRAWDIIEQEESGGEWKCIKENKADEWLENIFWFRYGVSINNILHTSESHICKCVFRRISAHFISLTDIAVYQEEKTKDLIIIGRFDEPVEACCFKNNDLCIISSHVIENIERINETFPNVFSRWKYVPMERGTSCAFYIRISACELKAPVFPVGTKKHFKPKEEHVLAFKKRYLYVPPIYRDALLVKHKNKR